MTEICKMIWDEGIKESEMKAKAEGRAEGKAEILIRLLIKKFKLVLDEYIKKIKKMPELTIEVIADVNKLCTQFVLKKQTIAS